MAAPRLNTASPNPAPRRTLINSGTVPTRRVLLKSGDGSVIHPKTSPAPEPAQHEAASTPAAPETEFNPSIPADQAVNTAPTPEEIAEYERQLEEYNRQMEDYNRQMAEYEAQQAAQKEEAARRAAEEEAARKAAEQEAARRAAEQEAARKAREELISARREAELAQAKAAAAAAAAAAAEAAARAQEAELKAKALAVQVPDGPVIKPVPTHDPAAAPAHRGGSPALRPAGLAKPAQATQPKSSVATLKPAGMAQPAPAPTAVSKSAVSTLKPSGMSKPAPAALPKTTISTLKPAAALPATEAAPGPAAATLKPAAPKPSPLRPVSAQSAAAAAPAAPAAAAAQKPAAAALRPAAARPAGAALKPAAARPAATALKPAAARLTKPNGAKTATPAAGDPQAAEPGEPHSGEQPGVTVDVPGEDLQPELTDEQLDARDAYLTMLQQQAEATPLHKRPVFYVCLGILAALGVGCTVYVMTVNKNARLTKEMRDRAENLKKLSLRAEHNVHEGKKADVKCSYDDAEFMLGLIIDPHQAAPNGDPLLGNRPIDGAMSFSPLLAYAAARDSKIEKLVFDGLREHCQTIDERLFEKLIGDIATATTGANNNKINDKLRLVAKAISDSKGWKDESAKNSKLARVWNAMVLRLTVKDLDEIIAQLSSKELDAGLAETLVNCLDTVLSKIEDPDEQSKTADRVFESINEEYRTNRKLILSLARCRSQKALEHFKGMMSDKNNWSKLLPFFAYWGDDSQLAYFGELRSQTGGEKRYEMLLDQAMGSVFGQNRDRSSEEAMNLLKACFGNPFPDTSDAVTIIEQVDGVNAFKKGTPERAAADKRYEEIKRDRETKIRVINTLSGLYDRPWVLEILDRYEKDGDRDISIRGKQAKERVKQNRENAEADSARRKAKYGS